MKLLPNPHRQLITSSRFKVLLIQDIHPYSLTPSRYLALSSEFVTPLHIKKHFQPSLLVSNILILLFHDEGRCRIETSISMD